MTELEVIRDLLTRVENRPSARAISLVALDEWERDQLCKVARHALELDRRWSATLQLVQTKADEWEARLPNSPDQVFKYHYQSRADGARELLQALKQLESE